MNYRFRNHSVIRQSSPRLNSVIVVGCALLYCRVFVYGAEAFVESHVTHSIICKVKWWLTSFSFTLAFGTMFVKTWRVYKIFTNKQLSKQEIFPDGSEVSHGKVFACTFNYASIWFVFWVIWKGLLLVIGLFLAWETRNVKFPSLNDSRYIGMSVYNVVIMTLITVSLSFVVGDGNIHAKFALFGTSFNVISTFTLLLLFVPKIAKQRARVTYPEQAQNTDHGTTPFDSFCLDHGLYADTMNVHTASVNEIHRD